jgi:hypothetical protein
MATGRPREQDTPRGPKRPDRDQLIGPEPGGLHQGAQKTSASTTPNTWPRNARRQSQIRTCHAGAIHTWGHVGTLKHYAGLLRQITDSAFKEGEHAA